MIFVYKKWDHFCKKLADNHLFSIPAVEVSRHTDKYLVLKHDVETNVPRAKKMAEIEAKYGHRGTYYVQAYLMTEEKNIVMLKEIQAMGHEVSYHYDVMDSSHGDLNAAKTEFEKNRKLFERNGFPVVTVCQHGNPVVERVGYTSNRDFFRSSEVQKLYPAISDIMVNFKEMAHTDYAYYSDAGRKFKMIFDPLYNDVIPSDEKNISYEDLDALLPEVLGEKNAIISTHPHRWTSSAFSYQVKAFMFKVIRGTAKLLMKVPFLKRIMARYYYLAKKI